MADRSKETRTNKWMEKQRKNSKTAGWITRSNEFAPEKSGEEKEAIQKRREDSDTRREMQIFIRNKHKKGRTREETLDRLRFAYKDEKYQRYWPYFEIWVNNVYDKEKIKIQDYIKKQYRNYTKNREEILERVKTTFKGEEYEKSYPFFEEWVDEIIKKEKDDMER